MLDGHVRAALHIVSGSVGHGASVVDRTLAGVYTVDVDGVFASEVPRHRVERRRLWQSCGLGSGGPPVDRRGARRARAKMVLATAIERERVEREGTPHSRRLFGLDASGSRAGVIPPWP
eukprot:scaffold240737_cov26-Tisochrysis_lutea.AAC.1